MSSKPRVIHFVTGGGSGATKVALELATGHLQTGRFEPLLVLRRKKVALPPAMQAQIEATKVPVAWVDRGFKSTTRRQLAELITHFRPHIFVAHGNSEHLWGRQAAFKASVPVVIHVEHNCERYTLWRRWQSRGLAKNTSATVCVSHGVANYLSDLRLNAPRLEVIHNGVDSTIFSTGATTLDERQPDIVMAARFARQKDHATLIRAAKHLVDGGWLGQLLLAGGGGHSHRDACERLAQHLGISSQVRFLGPVRDIASLYRGCRVAVLATKYEGMPLSLVEYMAAGCAAIASDIPGVTDVIRHGENGWLFPVGDDQALAKLLKNALVADPTIKAVAQRGQADAAAQFALSKMIARYESLFTELLAKSPAR